MMFLSYTNKAVAVEYNEPQSIGEVIREMMTHYVEPFSRGYFEGLEESARKECDNE